MKCLYLLWLALAGCAAQSTTISIVGRSTTTFGLSSANGPTVALNLSVTTTRVQVQPRALGFTVTWITPDASSVTVIAGPALAGTGKVLSCTATATSQVCNISGGTSVIPNGIAATVSVTASKTTALTLSAVSAVNKFGVPLLTAITPGGLVTTPVIVPPATLALITCASPQIESGEDVACVARLVQAAPALGATVQLTSSVPSLISIMGASGESLTTLLIPAGSISGSFIARGI